MRTRLRPLAIAASIIGSAIPIAAVAHHSFAMFDKTREVMLSGTITEFQWTNPHSFIQLSVTTGGKAVEWSLEGGSPNLLGRNGWKRTSLVSGDKVKVLINPLRSGKPGGSFLEVHKADGKIFYYHG